MTRQIDEVMTMDAFDIEIKKCARNYKRARELFYDVGASDLQHTQAWFHLQACVAILRDYNCWDEMMCQPDPDWCAGKHGEVTDV
jgi:hypothetical protein